MSCPDNALHNLDQLGDGIPAAGVMSWDDNTTQNLLTRCKCGKFKNAYKECRSCANKISSMVNHYGLEKTQAQELLDFTLSDEFTPEKLMEKVKAFGVSEVQRTSLIIGLQSGLERNGGDTSSAKTDPPNNHPPATGLAAQSSNLAETNYQTAKAQFIGLIGPGALDDGDNLAPGYEGLENMPMYQAFAQARDTYREQTGIGDAPELAEGEMSDGKYTVPPRLRTSIAAAGLTKTHSTALSNRFTQIGKDSATRQQKRIAKSISTILSKEGITNPDKIQQVIDAVNGREPNKGSGQGSSVSKSTANGSTNQNQSGAVSPKKTRQVSAATRQKLREAAAARTRCLDCGAFMGKTACKRCERIKGALKDVGIDPNRVTAVFTNITGSTRAIEQEFRKRNHTLMKQEAQDFLAEIGRADLVMPITEILDIQLGEQPEKPALAHLMTQDDWVKAGARPFINKDVFPDISAFGAAWPEMDWGTNDLEKQARLQHQLETLAALAIGQEVSLTNKMQYPNLPYDIPSPDVSQIANLYTIIVNNGEDGAEKTQLIVSSAHEQLLAMQEFILDDKPVEQRSQAGIQQMFAEFAVAHHVLTNATPPAAISEQLQKQAEAEEEEEDNIVSFSPETTTVPDATNDDNTETDAPQPDSPATSTGPVNCPQCGKFANIEEGCQNCGASSDDLAQMAGVPVTQTSYLYGVEGANNWTWITFPDAENMTKAEREAKYRPIFDAMRDRHRFKWARRRAGWYAQHEISREDIAALIQQHEQQSSETPAASAPAQAAEPMAAQDNPAAPEEATAVTTPEIPPVETPAAPAPAQVVEPMAAQDNPAVPEEATAVTTPEIPSVTRCEKCKSFMSSDAQNCKRCERYADVVAGLMALGKITQELADELHATSVAQLDELDALGYALDEVAASELAADLARVIVNNPDTNLTQNEKVALLLEARLLTSADGEWERFTQHYTENGHGTPPPPPERWTPGEKIDLILMNPGEGGGTATTVKTEYAAGYAFTKTRAVGGTMMEAAQAADLVNEIGSIENADINTPPLIRMALALDFAYKRANKPSEDNPFVNAMVNDGNYTLEDAVDAWARLNMYLADPSSDLFAIPEHILPTTLPDTAVDAAFNYIDDNIVPYRETLSSQEGEAQAAGQQPDQPGQQKCPKCQSFMSPGQPCKRCANLSENLEQLFAIETLNFSSAFIDTDVDQLMEDLSIAINQATQDGRGPDFYRLQMILQDAGIPPDTNLFDNLTTVITQYTNEINQATQDGREPDLDNLTRTRASVLMNAINGGQNNGQETNLDTGSDEPTSTEPAAATDTGQPESTLAGNAADDVPGTGGIGETGSGNSDSNRSNEGFNSNNGVSGAGDITGSLGTDEGGVGVPSGRERIAKVEVEEEPNKGTDYRITDTDEIGVGGAKTKARNNIDAIRLLKKLEEEDRPATPEEQAILVKYVGWGALPNCFDYANEHEYSRYSNRKNEWHEEYKALKELLTPEEWASAKESTLNAHYTSPVVIRSMWQALEEMGYSGGNVLEPAAGIGHFYGLMPESVRENSHRVAVELDSLTSRIMSKIYPETDLRNSGYERANLPDNYFDMVVSNVPFGNYPVSDPSFTGKKQKLTRSIHNYFFAKALDQAKPGGVVAFVTSHYTMDSKDPTVREYLASQADLLGAIRLPNTAFKQNAGTEVTTDIIFLRKRAPGEEPADTAWINAKQTMVPNSNGTTSEIFVNEYFGDNPNMMLGKMEATGSMYRDAQPQLVPDPARPMEDAFQDAIANLPKNIATSTNRKRCGCGAFMGETGVCNNPKCSTNRNVYSMASPELASTTYHGEYLLNDEGHLCTYDKNAEMLVPVQYQQTSSGKDPAKITRAVDAVPVKLAAKQLLELNATLDDDDDDEFTKAREELNAAYDAFVKKHGPLHKRGNLSALQDDPMLPVLLSLEHYDPESETAVKADIFDKRIINLAQRPDKAEDAEDALMISVFEGGVNWDRMNELTGIPIDELQAELVGLDLVYETPDGQWLLAEEYLSGNVRKKLEVAQAAAHLDPKFQRNVDALLAMQPAALNPSDIKLTLGAGWVPKEDVQAFIYYLLNERLDVDYIPDTATWHVSEGDNYQKQRLSRKTENTSTWGVPGTSGESGKTAVELIQDALNQKDSTITMENPDAEQRQKKARVTDQNQTLAAREMQSKLRAEFEKWAWSDPERSRRLVDIYNTKFNSVVPRTYHHPFRDDKNFLFPGQNPESFRLRNYQKDAVWRMVQGDPTYLAHIVGAGKSATAIVASMEMKRMGVRQKPMHVMPKHTLEQYATDFKRLYPAAKVLVVGEGAMSPSKRAETLSQIATNDWDAVLISEPSFTKMGVSPEVEAAFIQEQIAQYEERLKSIDTSNSNTYGYNRSRAKSPTVKQLEKDKKKLEVRLTNALSKLDKDDIGLPFEKLGVDHVVVDEAHYAKKVGIATNRDRVKGLDTGSSNRALNLYMTTKYLQNRCKCGKFVDRSGICNSCQHKTEIVPGGMTFMSGTPVTNTLAEIYTIQRMMMEKELEELGLGSFDAWSAQFTEMVSELEMKPSGSGYRSTTSLSKFTNVPELMRMLNGFMDWQMNPEKMGLKRPHLTNGSATDKLVYEETRAALLAFAGAEEENVLTAYDNLSPEYAHLSESPEWLAFSKARDDYRKPITVAVALNSHQKEIILDCEQRADNMPDDPREDNMLKVVNDARKASLDVRLVDPDAPDDPTSKVNTAVQNMLDIYQKNPGKTQMLFLDSGVPTNVRNPRLMFQEGIESTCAQVDIDLEDYGLTEAELARFAIDSMNSHLSSYSLNKRKQIDVPSGVLADVEAELKAAGVPAAKAKPLAVGVMNNLKDFKDAPRKFDLYNDMKQKLVAAGVPAQEIAFIHDASTDAQKLELFQDMNTGKVRFLFGSTGKMGTGVNAQKKLVALHHLDAPWRPDEVEQREGRILRHGNENEEVMILRYATEESFDVYMWQTLERKAGFIEQIRQGDLANRHMDDAASAVKLGYAEMKAVATGDPSVLELVGVTHELEKYEALEKAYKDKMQTMKWALNKVPKDIKKYQADIERLERVKAAVKEPADGEAAVIRVGGKTYEGAGSYLQSGEALQDLFEKKKVDLQSVRDGFFKLENVGEMYGVPVSIEAHHRDNYFAKQKGEMNWVVTAVVHAGGDDLRTDITGMQAQQAMMQIRRRIEKVDKDLQIAQVDLQLTQEKLPQLQAAVKDGFEYTDKVESLRQRKHELETRVGIIASSEKKQVFDPDTDFDDPEASDETFDDVLEEAEAMFG